jgi:predicted nucleic acid-binding protein
MKVRSALLDTSVLVAHLRKELDIGLWNTGDSVWYVSVISEGELMRGVYRSHNAAKNEARVRELLKDCTLLSASSDTAGHFGSIASKLDAVGSAIPHNDTWIAAHALEYNLALATRDAHFQRVKDLQVLIW